MARLLSAFGGLIVAAIALSFLFGLAGYVGVWVCWIGSVVDIIDQCKAPTTDSMAVALDLFKFFIGGSLCCAVGIWGCIITGMFSVAMFAYAVWGNKK